MIIILFKKIVPSVMIAMLAFMTLPSIAFAQEENPPQQQISTEKLEKAWAHQLKVYEKLSKVFDDTDAHLAQAQARIDKAASKGKDVSTVQAALNTFAAALERSRSIYNDISTLVNTHAGFDANGNVTDAVQAQTTVQAVRTSLQELKTSMDGSGKALRDAIRTFREANKPAEDGQTSKDS